MALPFNRFLQELIGGSGDVPNLPPSSQPVPSAPLPPVQGPVQARPPQMQAPVAPPPVMQAPVYQYPQQQPLSPQQYMQQQPQQGPVFTGQNQFPIQQPAPPEAAPDLNGTWVTVQYQYNGTTYNLLVPEANAIDLPDGANLIPNGTITNEPERVQRALDAGQNGVVGNTFIGTLGQAPPEIQGLFRSEAQQTGIDRNNPENRNQDVKQNQQALENMGLEPMGPTTQVPLTNAQGQTPDQVQADQISFDQLMSDVAQRGPEYVQTTQAAGPVLTTDKLRETDPVKAAQLEEAGIFEVRADQMVIQDASGGISVVPYSENVPQNVTVITYGGDTPTPGKRGFGSVGDAIGDAMRVMEIPQREVQSLVADAALFYAENVGETGTGFLTGALGQAPTGGAGLLGFTTWIVENEDKAREAKENGYTAPTGETFTGNRAVWELYQSERNFVERAVDTTISDPLNLLPSMGAPVRGVARTVGNARRGLGYTDEVVDVLNAADNVVDAVNPVRRTAQEVLTTTTDDVAKQGPGIVDEVIDAVPASVQPVTPSVAGQVVDKGLGAVETVLNVAADVLDVPEAALGALVDRGIITVKGLLDVVGGVPLPDGRKVSDLFALTDQTVIRNAEDEADIQFGNVINQDVNAPMGPAIPERPTGVVRDALPVNPRAVDEVIQTPAGVTAGTDEFGRIPVAPVEDRIVRPERTLPTDRPVDDLGQPVGQNVDRAAQALPTDRPIDDLVPQTPEDIATARDSAFLETPIGRQVQAKIDRWPEQYGYMKPQTAMERNVGVGRADEAFELRPVDIAREYATERPEQYRDFINDLDRSVRRKTGYFANEDARRATKAADLNLTSNRFADQREQGIDVRSMWEVVNEADHLINNELPLFNKHFADVADAPEYQWKRWGPAGNSHTAMDTLAQNGGKYVEGMPLGEATEIAIFHPDDNVRITAMEDITRRIANRDGSGRPIPGRVHSSISHIDGLRNVLSTGRRERRSIMNLRDAYQEAITANRSVVRQPLRAPEQAVPTPPAASVDAPDPFIDNLNAGAALEDAARNTNPKLLSLPATATAEPVPPIALYGPKPKVEPPMPGAPKVPPSAIQRSAQRMTRDLQTTQASDIRALTEYRRSRYNEQNLPLSTAPDAGRNVDTDPLTMGERRVETRRKYLSDKAWSKLSNLEATGKRLDDTDLASFYVRGRSVSESQARYFTQEFGDGETLAARWDRYTTEELGRAAGDVTMAESLAASRVINDYVAEIMPQKMRTQYDRELQKALRGKKEAPDGEMINRTQLEAQIEAMHKVRSNVPNNRFLRGYDRFVSALRQTFLYNWLTGPRYIATQMAGNTITAGVTKNWDTAVDTVSLRSLSDAWYAARNAGELPRSLMDEATDAYGLGGRRDLTRGTPAIRDQTLESAASTANKGGNSLLGKYTNPIADRRIRDMAGAYDRVARESLYVHYMDNNLATARQTLRERMVATAPQGVYPQYVERMFDVMPQRFSSDDLRQIFSDAPANWVDRNARDWQEALVKTDRAAREEVKRIFFDGSERNADRFFKRTLFFHYWMSRAVPLYTEAIARDPVMLYNFGKLLEAMENDNEIRQSKLYMAMQSPFGFDILIRPDAFFATFATMWDDQGYTPEGEGMLGRIFRNSPIMVNPLIQSGLNIVGAMGDTFAPDPLGLNKFLQFGGTAVDMLNAHFGWNLASPRNVQEKALRQARDFTSQYVGELPGFEHIPYTDPDGYRENRVRSIIAEIALERGLDLDSPVVQDAMVNPESELYQTAFTRAANQDAMDITMRIIPVTAVLYPKSQLRSPQERSGQLASQRATQDQLGIGTTPLAEDLYNERNMIAADSEYSRSMQIWQDQYRNLGTPEQQGAYQFYNNIRFGSLQHPIIVSGRRYMPDAVNAMDDTQRGALADVWAEETGTMEMIDAYSAERKAFREEHPEYQEYVSWQGQQRDYDGGVQAYWQDLIQGNPNAARYYNSLTPEQQQNEITLTSLEAYFATQGDKLAYWEPEPTDTRTQTPPGPYTPIEGSDGSASSSGGSGSRSGPSRESISQQALEYQQAMDAYDAAASQMMGQQFSVAEVNPMARQAIETNLQSIGVERPRMGRDLYGYMQWVELQQGGDTSIDAYLRYYATQNPPKPETPAT